jgi:molecular chaperone GrpE
MRSDQDGERLESELEAEAAGAENARDGALEGEGGGRGRASGEPASEGDAEAELAGARDRYLRLAAEFENYRKRTDRERGEGTVRAQAQLMERLLEPLDDLQRVAHFTSENATAESLLEGVQMVERKLLRVLESAGLETVEAKGERFDPSRHEALMTAEAEGQEEDEMVGEVFQKGYSFRGVLLRPARVQVKKHQG